MSASEVTNGIPAFTFRLTIIITFHFDNGPISNAEVKSLSPLVVTEVLSAYLMNVHDLPPGDKGVHV